MQGTNRRGYYTFSLSFLEKSAVCRKNSCSCANSRCTSSWRRARLACTCSAIHLRRWFGYESGCHGFWLRYEWLHAVPDFSFSSTSPAAIFRPIPPPLPVTSSSIALAGLRLSRSPPVESLLSRLAKITERPLPLAAAIWIE